VRRPTTVDDIKVLALVLAGGEGSRLRPLTQDLAKPALPFAGQHRVIDFVLSNLVNSGLRDIRVLAQYRAASLSAHVDRVWAPRGVSVGLPAPVASRQGVARFAGTADAVAQQLALIRRVAPDVVAVFGADHVYRMDVRLMLAAHLRRGADASVATLPVPAALAGSFGVVDVDTDARITGFREKQSSATGRPGDPDRVLASMGNYLFDTRVLCDVLEALADGQTDFGSHVLPRMVRSHRLFAHDFAAHRVPGVQDGEDAGYWRDVGTLDAYFDAHMDTIGPQPRFHVDNPSWPIHGAGAQASRATCDGASVHGSLLAGDCVLGRAVLDQAIVGPGVRVHDGAIVVRSVIMACATIGQGARVRNAIVEPGCAIAAGDAIGFDAARDGRRFHVSDGGVVVVTRERLARVSAEAGQPVHADA
jgi:glucose-1-phosphate adenylyltransferase